MACKQSNGLAAEKTEFFAAGGGYQNPRRFSPQTNTYVSFHELTGAAREPIWVFVKHQCLHCTHLYCAEVCAADVFLRNESGVVVCESDRCIGCCACLDSCPFAVPTIDYRDLPTPHVRKCGFCLGRRESEIPEVQLDGKPLGGESLARYQSGLRTPACAKACPTGAIQFGDRRRLLKEARRRIAARPDRYVDHIYGENEAGGTSWIYLSGVPFEKLGFPALPEKAEGNRPKLGTAVRSRALASRQNTGSPTLARLSINASSIIS